MAQYLLLEFDNDAQCKKLIEKIVAADRGFRVRGLFQKPTKLCECGPINPLDQHREVTRGAKFGWFVHRACRRAVKGPVSPRNLWEGPEAWLSLHSPDEPTANYPIIMRNR